MVVGDSENKQLQFETPHMHYLHTDKNRLTIIFKLLRFFLTNYHTEINSGTHYNSWLILYTSLVYFYSIKNHTPKLPLLTTPGWVSGNHRSANCYTCMVLSQHLARSQVTQTIIHLWYSLSQHLAGSQVTLKPLYIYGTHSLNAWPTALNILL